MYMCSSVVKDSGQHEHPHSHRTARAVLILFITVLISLLLVFVYYITHILKLLCFLCISLYGQNI